MSSTAKASPATTSTPILDRQAPLPPPANAVSGSIVALAMWFGLVFVFTVIILFWHSPLLESVTHRIFVDLDQVFPSANPLRFFIVFVVAFVVIFVVTAIHELGHVFAGMLAGFRFNSLRVGRIQFDRPFRFSLYRGKGAGSGGWASMFPTKLDNLVWRAVAMIFAGPAVNLLTVVFVLLLPLSSSPLLNFFTIYSLILGVINLLPFRSGAFHSDGSRLVMLLSNRARGERWVAMLKLSAELRDGVMSESLSPDYLAKAIALRDNSPDTVTAHSLAYSAAYHQHKDEKAAEMLEVCLQYTNFTSRLIRTALVSDAAVFQARRRHNIELAKQWLADVPESKEIPWMRTRAEAAVLEAQGDLPAALKKLDETEKLILVTPNQVRREISLRFIQRWQGELREQLGARG